MWLSRSGHRTLTPPFRAPRHVVRPPSQIAARGGGAPPDAWSAHAFMIERWSTYDSSTSAISSGVKRASGVPYAAACHAIASFEISRPEKP